MEYSPTDHVRVETPLRERQGSLVCPEVSRVTSCYCLLGRIFYSTINACVNVCLARVTLEITALSPAGIVEIVYSIIILNKNIFFQPFIRSTASVKTFSLAVHLFYLIRSNISSSLLPFVLRYPFLIPSLTVRSAVRTDIVRNVSA